MLVARPILPLFLLGVLTVGLPASAYAELVRIELGEQVDRGLPRSFEELERRIEAAGYAISYSEPPYYDPYYMYNSGGNAAYVSVSWMQTSIEVTWVELDQPGAAEEYCDNQTVSYGTNSYMQCRAEGRVMVMVWAYDYLPETAIEMITALGGS